MCILRLFLVLRLSVYTWDIFLAFRHHWLSSCLHSSVFWEVGCDTQQRSRPVTTSQLHQEDTQPWLARQPGHGEEEERQVENLYLTSPTLTRHVPKTVSPCRGLINWWMQWRVMNYSVLWTLTQGTIRSRCIYLMKIRWCSSPIKGFIANALQIEERQSNFLADGQQGLQGADQTYHGG